MRHYFTTRPGCRVLLCAAVLGACTKAPDSAGPLGTAASQDGKQAPGRAYQAADFAGPAGGGTTVSQADALAFAQPSPTLGGPGVQDHADGQQNFEHVWSVQQLAPLWNNNNCAGCHVHGGRSPLNRDPQVPQLLFRVSIPGTNPDGGPNPVPGFGDQLQPVALVNGQVVFGNGPEGAVTTSYVEQLGAFADGQAYSLRAPTYTPTATLPGNVMVSPRIGPQIAGLGLLAAVDEQEILGLADPGDKDGDGIAGRPNYVWNVATQQPALGRFGWKANQPNLLQQAAAAFNGDLGVTSPYFPLESNVPGGGRNKKGKKDDDTDTTRLVTDIDARTLATVAYYTGTLGVPAARGAGSAQVQAGQTLFVAAKCAACHAPVLHAMADAPAGQDGKDKKDKSQKDNPAGTASLSSLLFPTGLGSQTIHPYTDLLLHDMGPGLADGRPDFQASGSEWRTAPLWGLGLSATTSHHTNYLHDGRARNVLEAIMWHGGEGDYSRRYVQQLSQADRDALVAFVQSL